MALPIFMTAEGLAKARQELARRYDELSVICEERTVAHALSGDGWHDNPHFNRLQQIEADKTRAIASQRSLIENARLIRIDPQQRPLLNVGIGSLVLVEVWSKGTRAGSEQLWEIVGYGETDIPLKKLAYNTPLASPLIGLEVGEEVEAALPGGLHRLTVLELLAQMPADLG